MRRLLLLHLWLLTFLSMAVLPGAPGGAGVAHAQSGGSLAFDGINDYVTFGPAPEIGLATFTIETRFRWTGGGVTTSTGNEVAAAIPLLTKGRREADGNTADINYFLGIQDGKLVADLEEGATANPGRNHPLFGQTTVEPDRWYHAAATYDGTVFRLYLDGVLEAQKTIGRTPRADSRQHAALGTALTTAGVPQGYFAGELDEARIWNYGRSQAEIQAAMNQEITSAPGLVARWGLNDAAGYSAANSVAGSPAGTLVGEPTWVTSALPPALAELVTPAAQATGLSTDVSLQVRATDPEGGPLTVNFYGRPIAASSSTAPFTIVLMPDPQNFTLSDEAMSRVHAQTQWILDQRAALNIQFMIQLGDLTDNSDDAEWQRISPALAVLDNAAMPQGITPGNHDMDIVNGRGSDFLRYDQYFPPSRYEPFAWYAGYLGDPNDGIYDFGVNRLNKDSYQLFSAGGMGFLVLNLEFDPPQYVLDWANAVLARYPNHRAIVSSHDFLTETGVRRSVPYIRAIGKSAEDLWQQVIYPNCNVFLVVNGHNPGEARRTDPNRCGQPVHQLLQDYQNRGDGWLRYLVFEPAEDQIEVYTYSPFRDRYETDADSRFTLDYAMETGTYAGAGFQKLGERIVNSGEVAEFTWQGLAADTAYEWFAVVDDGLLQSAGPTWSFVTGNGGGSTPAPAAQPDAYTTAEDTVLTVPASGVLANDSAPSGTVLTALLGAPPANGTLTLAADGGFQYTPAPNFNGHDSFTYLAHAEGPNGGADSGLVTVELNVTPVNDPPLAGADAAETDAGTPVVLSLLANDSDPDGQGLTISGLGTPAHGMVILNGDGTVTYTPAAGWAGVDSFTYTISDGNGGSATGQVSVTTRSAPATSTPTPTPSPTPSPTPGPIPSPTPSPTPGPLPDTMIFADGFECSIAAWSGRVGTARLLPQAGAAYQSGCGLAVNIPSTSPSYVYDDRPAAETEYYARFAFHPNTLVMAEGDEFSLFRGYLASGTAIFTLDVRFNSGQRELRAGLSNDKVRWVFTPWVPVTVEWHLVDLQWRAAQAAGANNGGLALVLDGVLVAAGNTVDNDLHQLERVQLGTVRALDAGTQGVLYLDEFASARSPFVGTAGAIDGASPAPLIEEEYMAGDTPFDAVPEDEEPVNEEPVNEEPVNEEPVNEEPVNEPVNEEPEAGLPSIYLPLIQTAK